MWQRFFQLKKTEKVTIQAHTASIHKYADRLTGLGDSPLSTLTPIVRNLTLLFSVVSTKKCASFPF